MAMSPQERTVFLYTRGRIHGWHTYSPWQCQSCETTFPVVSMARSCEAKHEEEGWPVPQIYKEAAS